MQKSQKKKKKNFSWDVFSSGFPISGDKKGERSKWFCFSSVRGDRKCEINYRKTETFYFSFAEVFDHFGRSFPGKDD